MHFDELRLAQFSDLADEQEFWLPALHGAPPRSMAELRGPYCVYAATGHVLNKLFDLPRRMDDHELRRVAFDPARRELSLMEAADGVYVAK